MIIRVGFILFICTSVYSDDIHNEAPSKQSIESPKSLDDSANSIHQNVGQGVQGQAGFNEGNGKPSIPAPPITSNATDVKSETISNNNTLVNPKDTQNATKVSNDTKATEVNKANSTNVHSNVTTISDNAAQLNNPGVVKRGLIVFGGFALLAIAYLIFYRKKNKNYDSNSTHNTNDANQFRYGVLQSDDRRDNLELSRIPLTMESDDEEDEDLELFDLEQKKKSLSYVNLQTNDEDIVLKSSKDESKNNLLLDIEDGPSEAWANWSNDGNRSIL